VGYSPQLSSSKGLRTFGLAKGAPLRYCDCKEDMWPGSPDAGSSV
jgi:hypothetical protein